MINKNIDYVQTNVEIKDMYLDWKRGERCGNIIRQIAKKIKIPMKHVIKIIISYELKNILINTKYEIENITEEEVMKNLSFILSNLDAQKIIPHYFKVINWMDIVNVIYDKPVFNELDQVRFFYNEKLDKNRELPAGILYGKTAPQVYLNFYEMLRIALDREGIDIENEEDDNLLCRTLSTSFLERYKLINSFKCTFEKTDDMLIRMFGIDRKSYECEQFSLDLD